MTIIVRITDGGCRVDPGKADGIRGVRVMLQDGSYTVTDEDGRYHYEGVRPGLHVVQIDPSTLPLDREAIDCARATQSAGRDRERGVEGKRVGVRVDLGGGRIMTKESKNRSRLDKNRSPKR